MIRSEKYQWLWFSTEADDDDLAPGTNVCYRADNLIGGYPTGDSELTLSFKPLRFSTGAANDTVALTLTNANTAKDVLTELVQNINNTRPTNAGFLKVADDRTTLVGGSATETPVYFSSGVSACGAISIASASALNGNITATDDGTGTGVVPNGGTYIVSADGDANHIATLPTPKAGMTVFLDCSSDSTGFELRTSNPSAIKINDGSGSNAESAIAASIGLVRCVAVNPTNWHVVGFTQDGGAIAAIAKAA